MKLISVLFLNLATVVVAIVAYDQLRREPAPPSAVVDGSRIDETALLKRIAALEDERRVHLGGSGTDPLVLARLDALEKSLAAQDVSEAPTVAEPIPDETPLVDAHRAASAADVEIEAYEPTPAEVGRWRRVRDAVRRQEGIEKNRRRFDRALDKLPLNLTPRQREKIHAAYATFEPRIQEIWTEVKVQAQATVAAGGEVDRKEIVTETTVVIQQEFAEALTGIVHAVDAEAVAGAMIPIKGR